MKENIFADVKNVEELLGQLAGAASMAWQPRPHGVFDGSLASDLVQDAVTRLSQLIGNVK